jgi:hypothetical protein
VNKGEAVAKFRSNNWTKPNPDILIRNQRSIAKNINKIKIEKIEKRLYLLRGQVNNFIDTYGN